MTHLHSLIHQALEDGLPPSERSRLDEHLQGCDSCRRFDAELRRNEELLGRREPLPPIPPRRARERSLLGTAGPLAVGFATVLLALGVGAQLTEWRTQNATTAAAAPSSSPSAAVTPLPSEPMPSQSVVVSAGAPQCPAGEMPILDVAHPAPPGDPPGSGSADPEAAFRTRYPALSDFAMYAWGSERPANDVSELGSGPVWIVAGDETFVALSPGAKDNSNGWFAYPAKFVGCRVPSAQESTRSSGFTESRSSARSGSDASPFPIRWQLKQPIQYTNGAWTFTGFVENNFTSAARDIQLEISLPSGEVLVHPVASRLGPGERAEYVFRVARPEIDGWTARARFQLSEWPR